MTDQVINFRRPANRFVIGHIISHVNQVMRQRPKNFPQNDVESTHGPQSSQLKRRTSKNNSIVHSWSTWSAYRRNQMQNRCKWAPCPSIRTMQMNVFHRIFLGIFLFFFTYLRKKKMYRPRPRYQPARSGLPSFFFRILNQSIHKQTTKVRRISRSFPFIVLKIKKSQKLNSMKFNLLFFQIFKNLIKLN